MKKTIKINNVLFSSVLTRRIINPSSGCSPQSLRQTLRIKSAALQRSRIITLPFLWHLFLLEQTLIQATARQYTLATLCPFSINPTKTVSAEYWTKTNIRQHLPKVLFSIFLPSADYKVVTIFTIFHLLKVLVTLSSIIAFSCSDCY
jgi:hypothetical protein